MTAELDQCLNHGDEDLLALLTRKKVVRMSLRINTNLASLNVQNAMSSSQKETERASKNLASGSRLADPSADVAGKAISEQMNSEIKGMEVAKRNAEQGVSFAQIAEGGLSEQSNIIIRMRELAVQSASDTYSDRERSFMQNEYSNLQLELDRIAKTSSFGSKKLLDGSGGAVDIQVGIRGDKNSRVSFNSETDTTLSALQLDSASVLDKEGARESLESLDTALTQLSLERSKFGALQSRLESAQNSLGSSIENTSAARSQINDADIAQEVSALRRGQILEQYQTVLLQQANERTGSALRLIG